VNSSRNVLVSERRGRHAARRARRRRVAWIFLGFLAGAVLFVAGVALGRALEEEPPPGGTQTLVRTLAPNTLPPVTVTNP
jgi:hypothetical protein